MRCHVWCWALSWHRSPIPTRKGDLWSVCTGLLSSPHSMSQSCSTRSQDCGFPLSHISQYRCREPPSLSAEQLNKIVDILHLFGCLVVWLSGAREFAQDHICPQVKKQALLCLQSSNVIFKIVVHLVDVQWFLKLVMMQYPLLFIIFFLLPSLGLICSLCSNY